MTERVKKLIEIEAEWDPKSIFIDSSVLVLCSIKLNGHVKCQISKQYAVLFLRWRLPFIFEFRSLGFCWKFCGAFYLTDLYKMHFII